MNEYKYEFIMYIPLQTLCLCIWGFELYYIVFFKDVFYCYYVF